MDTINLVNNGKPYFFRLDIAKESGQIARFTDWIKTRVSDNGKKVPIQWYDQGTVMNVHGFYPFIEGGVGKWIKDDDTGELVPSTDVVYRTWQGTPDDTSDNGIAYYTLEDQFFTKQGEFVGTFGLRDDNGNNLTSVNLVFSVLGNDLRLTQAKDYYIKDLENLKRKFENDGNVAIQQLHDKYKGKAQQSEDELDSINKNFGTINAALKSVGLSTAALQNQIDSENLESVQNHNADIYLLKQDIVNRFGQLKHPTQVFDSLTQIQAKYPNGTDGSMLTTDNGHIYVYNWNTNLWKDFGVFQAQGLPPEITETLNKSVKGYKVLLKEIDPPYDNLDTLPANQIVTYAYPEYTANVRNWPANNTGRIATVFTLSASGNIEGGGAVQMIFFNSGEMQYRTNWGIPAKYSKWHGLPLISQVIQQHIDTIQPPYNDLNEIPENSLINYSCDLDKLKNSPVNSDDNTSGIVITTNSAIGYGTIQIILTVSGRNYWRFKWYDGNTWIHWLSNGNTLNNKRINMRDQIKSEYTDLHTIKNNKSVTYAISSEDLKSVSNRPSDNPLTITTLNGTNDEDPSGKVQIVVDANGQMFYSIYWYNRWTDWAKVKTNQNLSNTDFTSVAMFRSIGIIGDSYASGELAIDKYTDHYNMSWGQIMARRNGATAINFSKGGQTTRGWLTDQERGLGLLKSAPSLDLYILALGINDYGKLGTDYIGNTGDMGTDADTFYGNYGKIIQAIKDKSPNAKIVISTLSQTGTVPDLFSSAIRTIAQHYGIPCLELNSDPFFTSSYYLSHLHGGHPTGPVYSGMAKAYERLIENSMVMNLDYFETFENEQETDAVNDMERIKKMSN